MENSILISTKKLLGLSEEYTPFDLDIILHINSTFAVISQLGVGPTTAFTIEDDTSKWDSFVTANESLKSLVKTYMSLKVRALFDPPSTPHHISAMKDLIEEYEWRLNQAREEITPWTAPTA